MAYNYLYIDDIQNELEKGIIAGIEYGGEIKIDFRNIKLNY